MIELKIVKRDKEGSNEQLRGQGLVPAVLYGADFKSTPVSVNDIEFRKVYRDVGTSNIINTIGDIKGEMCIVQDMHVHVVSGEILHIDFKVVEKGQKTEVTVPITFVGESIVEKNSLGIISFSHEEALIETIPSNIPDQIEVDISILKEVGDSIKLGDIKFPDGVELLDNPEITIASAIIPKENEEEPEEVAVDTEMEPELVDQKGSDVEIDHGQDTE